MYEHGLNTDYAQKKNSLLGGETCSYQIYLDDFENIRRIAYTKNA